MSVSFSFLGDNSVNRKKTFLYFSMIDKLDIMKKEAKWKVTPHTWAAVSYQKFSILDCFHEDSSLIDRVDIGTLEMQPFFFLVKIIITSA